MLFVNVIMKLGIPGVLSVCFGGVVSIGVVCWFGLVTPLGVVSRSKIIIVVIPNIMRKGNGFVCGSVGGGISFFGFLVFGFTWDGS